MVNRRHMISTCAGALLSAGGVSRLLAAEKSASGFRIGACDWSIGCHSDIRCFDVAKQIGLDGVQVSMGRVSNDMHMRQAAVREKYLAASKKTGVAIASLAIGEMNSVPLKSDPRAAKWLDESIDIAKALGVTVSMPAFFGRGDLDMKKTKEIDRVVGVLKDVAPKAERQGIIIGLENYLSAEDNLKLIDRVGSKAVSVYYDVGNSTDKGYDIYSEIRLLGRLGRLCEFHAKDGRFMLGKGRVDFKKVRRAMDDVGYRGWIQLEAARPNGLIQDYTAHLNFLRGVFPKSV